jgi:hypothetical protein
VTDESPTPDSESTGQLAAATERVVALTKALTARAESAAPPKPPRDWPYALAIPIAVAANFAAFKYLFSTNYIHWCITYGPKFALAATVFSLTIQLDDDRRLIAANPTEYIRAWFIVFTTGSAWLSHVLDPDPSKWGFATFRDSLLTMAFGVAWTAAAFAWMLVVVPPLYLINLVCGAPIRLTLSSLTDEVLTLTPLNPTPGHDKPRQIHVDLNIRNKPVTATNAISAVALYGLGFAV